MDPESKKKLLRHIPSGLYVIGLSRDGEHHAFTGSFLSQMSLKPPGIMTAVRKESKSFEILSQSKVFTVNFIHKDRRATLEHFFKPATSREGNRLGSFPCRTGKTGAPILDEAIGHLECEVRSIADSFGDHAVVIAEVVDAVVREDVAPLIMSDTPWHYGG